MKTLILALLLTSTAHAIDVSIDPETKEMTIDYGNNCMVTISDGDEEAQVFGDCPKTVILPTRE